MKTHKLIALYFFAAAAVFAETKLPYLPFTDFFSGGGGKFSVSDKKGFSAERNDFIAGAKIHAGTVSFSVYKKEEKFTSGFSFLAQDSNRNFMMNFLAGSLNLSGAITKINSPALPASASPFAVPTVSAKNISASIPGRNSFSNPMAAFIRTEFPGVRTSVSLTANSDGDAAASVLTGFSAAEIKFAASATAGIFAYSRKSAKYRGGNTGGFHFCGRTELSAVFGNFSSILSAGFYESPEKNLLSTVSFDGKFSRHRNTTFVSVFLNPSGDIITGSEKRIGRCLQAKAGIQGQLAKGTGKNPPIRGGLTLFADIQPDTGIHDFRAGAGIKSAAGKFSSSAGIQAGLSVDRKNSAIIPGKISASLKNSFGKGKFRAGADILAEVTPENGKSASSSTEKITVFGNIGSNPSFYQDLSLSLKQKNGEFTRGKVSATTKTVWRTRRTSCTARISFEFSF